MKILRTIPAVKAYSKALKAQGKTLAFVPTMGNLHAGHLSLVKLAQQHADKVMVSIFVNPAQFGPKEDFATYPRTFEADCEKLAPLNVDAVFAPDTRDMYPADVATHTLVKNPALSPILCGKTRPIFFQGITTVVCKLFNIIKPDCAVFGEKDYQQWLCIQQMVNDMHMDIEIIRAPIVREPSGLAMSSRNQYLTDEQKALGALLFEELSGIKTAIKQGASDFEALVEAGKHTLNDAGFQSDYIAIMNPCDLTPATPEDSDFIILGAAQLGKARLIDNLLFSREEPSCK